MTVARSGSARAAVGMVLGLSLLGAAGWVGLTGSGPPAATASAAGVVPPVEPAATPTPRATTPPRPPRPTAPPTLLGIPSLGVLAPIEPVGTDIRTGELDIPSDVRRIGWWDQGPRPGSRYGTVVLTGHIDAVGQGPGALARLRTLAPGQPVVVAAGGTPYRYTVVARREYLKSDLPREVFSPVGARRLVIVSCGGPFDERTHHYRDNIVIYAVPTG